MSDNAALCTVCDYEYKDTPGMGVHKVPTRCPKCGGRILIGPAFTRVDGKKVHATPIEIAGDWKLRGL